MAIKIISTKKGRTEARDISALLSEEVPTKRDIDIGTLHKFRQINERDNSCVYYAESNKLPTPAAVKICRHPTTGAADRESARRQYDALVAVWNASIKSKSPLVPRPYALFEDRALLVTEWVHGTVMSHDLFTWLCSRDKSRRLCENAGIWLKQFHSLHELEPGTLDTDDKQEQLLEMKRCSLSNNAIYAHGLDILLNASHRAEDHLLTRSWVHGDFKSDNLIVTNSNILGIDLHISHENVVVYDIASFLNHIELTYCFHLGWRCGTRRRQMRDDFVRAYFGKEIVRIQAPLLWAQLYQLLSVWRMTFKTKSNRFFLKMAVNSLFQESAYNLSTRLKNYI